MNDFDRGTKVLKAFYSWSRNFYPSGFPYPTFESFLAVYGNKASIYADGIGAGVRFAEISDSRINTAMMNLAKQAQGKIPKNQQDYIDFLSNEATQVNFLDAVSFTAVESLKDIASGAQAIGNSIITSGKMLTFLLPAVVLIFLLFFVNKHTEGSLGKVAGALRK